MNRRKLEDYLGYNYSLAGEYLRTKYPCYVVFPRSSNRKWFALRKELRFQNGLSQAKLAVR